MIIILFAQVLIANWKGSTKLLCQHFSLEAVGDETVYSSI